VVKVPAPATTLLAMRFMHPSEPQTAPTITQKPKRPLQMFKNATCLEVMRGGSEEHQNGGGREPVRGWLASSAACGEAMCHTV